MFATFLPQIRQRNIGTVFQNQILLSVLTNASAFAAAAKIRGTAILDAEVVWLDSDGVDFDALHSRVNDQNASACAFDLLMVNGDDLWRWPYVERKAALRKLLRQGRGIQYVEHAEGHGDKLYAAACKLGLEGIVSKKLDAPYRSGRSKTWIKVKNPKAPAATRAADGTFSGY